MAGWRERTERDFELPESPGTSGRPVMPRIFGYIVFAILVAAGSIIIWTSATENSTRAEDIRDTKTRLVKTSGMIEAPDRNINDLYRLKNELTELRSAITELEKERSAIDAKISRAITKIKNRQFQRRQRE